MAKIRTSLIHHPSSHTVRHTSDQETSPEANFHQRPALFGLFEVFLGGEAGHDHGGDIGEELILAIFVSLAILAWDRKDMEKEVSRGDHAAECYRVRESRKGRVMCHMAMRMGQGDDDTLVTFLYW